MDVQDLGPHHLDHLFRLHVYPPPTPAHHQTRAACSLVLRRKGPLFRLEPDCPSHGEELDDLHTTKADNILLVQSATTFIFSLAFFAVSLLLTTYVDAVANASSANAVLAVLNVSTTASQLGIGWLSDRFEAHNIMASMAFISCLSAVTSWALADTLGKVFAFAVLFGGFSGICALWSDTGRDVAGDF